MTKVETVINELKEKMASLKFRLLDCQDQNQMLRKELLMARKVVNNELFGGTCENFDEMVYQGPTTDFRGRREQILTLKNKLSDLQNRIKELEGDTDRPSEETKKIPKTSNYFRKTERSQIRNKQVLDKELKDLLQDSCRLKRKSEECKKRNAELSKEAELLRLEVERLAEKSKEDENVHKSYRDVEKELRAKQSEKLEMRSKLDIEKIRNGHLAQEIAMVKENISIILSKMNDDKTLIDSLNNQQGCLHDLLEHQKMSAESDNRRYRDDLREIQMKHASNTTTLSHLDDILEEKSFALKELQEALQQKVLIDDVDDKEEVVMPEPKSQQDEPETEAKRDPSEGIPESDPDEEAVREEETRNEIRKLSEECEEYKSLFRSSYEEMNQLIKSILTSNERLNEWTSQLRDTRSLYSQKSAEVCDLEETVKRLQRSSAGNKKNESGRPAPNSTDEMIKMNDVLNEEYRYLITLWDFLMSSKENSLEVYATSVECTHKCFANTVNYLLKTEITKMAEEEQSQSQMDAEETS